MKQQAIKMCWCWCCFYYFVHVCVCVLDADHQCDWHLSGRWFGIGLWYTHISGTISQELILSIQRKKKSNPSLFCVSFCGLCFSILFQFDTCAPVSDLCFCFRVDLRERKPKSCGSHSPEGCFDSAPGLPPLLGCPHQHRAHPTRRQTESRGVTVSAQPLMSLIHNGVLTSLYSWIKEGFTAYESNF